MNIFDNIEQCISNLPYNISSIKAWYDGTITFRMSEFLCDVSLDVIQSEIRLTLSIDEDSFTNREITVSDSGLIYLANVLNSNIDAVSFFALIEDGAQSLCLKKHTTTQPAMRPCDSCIKVSHLLKESLKRLFQWPSFSLPKRTQLIFMTV